jgi:hypothetical protein
MNTVIKNPPFQFQLSEGYRAARRMNSFFCAIALAWSAAQFDLKVLTLQYVGSIDLSRASIPLILTCAIAYSTIRLVLEFRMQSVEIRRWVYAQTDFRISIHLVRFAILMVAASGISRSVDNVIYLMVAAVGIFLIFFFFWLILMMILPFIFISWRNSPGHYHSAAAGAEESLAWGQLVSVCIISAIFVALGIAALRYESFLSLWTSPPRSIAMGFFVFACIVIMFSIYIQPLWHKDLFVIPENFVEKTLPDGTKLIDFNKEHYSPIRDWYSQPASGEKSQGKTSGE